MDVDLGVNLEDLTFLDSQQDKRGLCKCAVNKDQLPNDKIKIYPIEKGDVIFLSSVGMGEIYSAGHKIKKTKIFNKIIIEYEKKHKTTGNKTLWGKYQSHIK